MPPVYDPERRDYNQGSISENPQKVSDERKSFYGGPSARSILEQQMKGASREINDLQIVMNMLPAQMTAEQDEAFCRLLLRDMTFPFGRLGR